MGESGVMEWFSGIHGTPLDILFEGLSYSATAGIIWLVLGALIMWSGRRADGASMMLSVVLALCICDLVLKPIVDRDRPFDELDLDVLMSIPTTSSFPSGHTASAFAGAVSLLMIDRRWGIAALTYAALVALSRVYVCAHWPTDVIAGAVLGAAMAAIVFYAVRRCRSNRIESTEL
ncbi:MAG: phosphatase PAP2 family protein [Candidatus Methanomethylophilaceae archaeon]|nr:phosphatase PAP2 family protein [Candidatus Methanomethylophilaceae archaeon]